jgi:hypothetical protein
MSRITKSAVFAAACLALVAAPAYAAKGGSGGGGNGTATIAFATTGFAAAAGTGGTAASSSVSFSVTANVKSADVANLWVANICTQNGVTVSAEYHQVQNWVAGPFATSGSQCKAYVWMFPDAWTPLKGGSMTYSVTG